MTLPGLFTRAAELARERGMCQGRQEDAEGHVCASGALYRATLDVLRMSEADAWDDVEVRRVYFEARRKADDKAFEMYADKARYIVMLNDGSVDGPELALTVFDKLAVDE